MYDPPGPNFIVPTPPVGDSSNQAADTAFVQNAVTSYVSTAVVSTSYITANTVANITSTYGLTQTNTTGSVSLGVSLTATSNSLGADVHVSTSVYTDGPSVAQGTTGTFFASGNVTVNDQVNSSFDIKLWDGSTVIDSCLQAITATTQATLSGFIKNPVGNLRISCKDLSSIGNGTMFFNASGNSKDSTITVIRIG